VAVAIRPRCRSTSSSRSTSFQACFWKSQIRFELVDGVHLVEKVEHDVGVRFVTDIAAVLPEPIWDRSYSAKDPNGQAQVRDIDVPERLRQLAELHQEGLISDQEYVAKRAELLRYL
jgi:hypothetical protein